MRWKKLRVLGPLDAKVWKVDVGGREGAVELWKLPKGKRLLELSVKCGAGEATGVRATMLAFLAGHGLGAATSADSKTEQAFAALGSPK